MSKQSPKNGQDSKGKEPRPAGAVAEVKAELRRLLADLSGEAGGETSDLLRWLLSRAEEDTEARDALSEAIELLRQEAAADALEGLAEYVLKHREAILRRAETAKKEP